MSNKKITIIKPNDEKVEIEAKQIILSSDDGELEINFGGYKSSDITIIAPTSEAIPGARFLEVYPGACNMISVKLASVKGIKSA